MANMKETFVDLLKSSTLIQGTIALVATGTVAYLYIVGRPVPDTLVSLTMLIVGYYFGGKTQQAIEKGVKDYVTKP